MSPARPSASSSPSAGPAPTRDPGSRARIAGRLEQSVGRLSTTALQRMERDMAWFRDLGPQERSWIGLVVQAGIASFVEWYRDPGAASPSLRAEVFGNAPRAFAGQISLPRTVAMVRLSIEVVEENIGEVLGARDARPVYEAITRYGREVAFATAEIYARAAEMRGAWDARLEALVVDSVLRGETDGEVESRASALGWSVPGNLVTMVGPVPVAPPPDPHGQAGGPEPRRTTDGRDPIDDVRRIAHEHGVRSLSAIQGDRLVVIVGCGARTLPLEELTRTFGPGPVVLGPPVDALVDVPASAAAALAGYRCAAAWAGVPRPVAADDLLPERALSGDERARAHLVSEIHRPLAEAGPVVLETLQAYLDGGGSLEATARTLFVHANTVRYRLRRAHEVTGLDPTDARDAYTLRIAMTLGRLVGPG